MGRLPSRLPVYPFGDNEKINFGSNNDARIYYDGTDLKIEPANVGSGKVDFGGDITLTSDTSKIYFGAGDNAYIYFDGDDLKINTGGDEIWLQSGGSDKLGASSVYNYSNVPFIAGGNRTLDLGLSNRLWKDLYIEQIIASADNATGSSNTFGYDTLTTTGNIVAVDIDASTNLTMGTDFGATGLKINVAAPNGSGKSQGIDLSSLAVDFPAFKVVSDAGNTAGALTGQIAIDVAGTTYYLYYYTTSTVT